MQFYISVMFLGLPDDIHEEKPSFLQSKKTHYGRTDRRTDRLSYRDARTHLKRKEMSSRGDIVENFSNQNAKSIIDLQATHI